LLQADLAKIGIQAEIRVIEWGELIRRAKAGEHDLLFMGWAGDNGDPDNFLSPQFSCAAVKSGTNFARFCDSRLDKLISAGKPPATRACAAAVPAGAGADPAAGAVAAAGASDGGALTRKASRVPGQPVWAAGFRKVGDQVGLQASRDDPVNGTAPALTLPCRSGLIASPFVPASCPSHIHPCSAMDSGSPSPMMK
jgi:hypothetical protein